MEMMMNVDPFFSTLHHLLDLDVDVDVEGDGEKPSNAPTRAYVRDRKAMASTPADVIELPGALVFVIDMPGVKPGEIKVEVEGESRVLVVSGKRKRWSPAAEGEGGAPRFVLMERRVGKFMRRFALPENADVEGVTAACRDGVLTVTVKKKAPPEPKTVEVKFE